MLFYQRALGGDVTVLSPDALDVAQADLTEARARLAGHQPHPDQYRVFTDPAGHPFCICLPADWA